MGEALDRQAILLTGHVFIMVAAGCVIVERGSEQQVVEAGGIAIVQEGPVELTEIPVDQGSYGEVYYFFLNAGVLRDWMRPGTAIERIALSMTPWPFEIGVTPQGLANLMPVMEWAGALFPYHFTKVLTVTTNQMSAAMFSFIAQAFCLPRLRLNLFMEQHVLDCWSGHDYPGGVRALAHDLRVYQGTTAETWLRKRRMQLAQTWMTHGGVDLGTTAAKLHYSDPKEFENDFRRENRVRAGSIQKQRSWKDLNTETLQSVYRPFWLGTQKATPWNHGVPLATWDEVDPTEAEASFWNANSTIGLVDKVIRVSFGVCSTAAALSGERAKAA